MNKMTKRRFMNWLVWTVGAASIPFAVNFCVHLERGNLGVFNVFDSATLLFLSIVVCASLLSRIIGIFALLDYRKAMTLFSFFAFAGALACICIGILESHRSVSTLQMESAVATICHELPTCSFQVTCIILTVLVLAVGVAAYDSSLLVEHSVDTEEVASANV